MSLNLKKYIDSFLEKEISADAFVDNYMSKWKQERDQKALAKDEDNLSELLSSTFCAVDMYNPDEDREEYEFNEDELRSELNKLMFNYLNK